MNELKHLDPEIYKAISDEEKRQTRTINLIASENFSSEAVRQAAGSYLTHKYAEGYPGKRYYGGCENADIVESLALERLRALFKAEYANVQPHSGSQANMAVYFGTLSPGDALLGMDLAHGGHLSHGSQVNFSGKLYQCYFYGVDQETQTIDYNQVRELARKHQPKIIVAGASTYPRYIDYIKFREIADEVGALLVADMAHIAGLIAAGLHPSPVGPAHFITSTTHKSMRGPRGGFILSTENYAQMLDSQIFPGIQGGPLMHIIAAKAVAFGEALNQDFNLYQTQVQKNAKRMAQSLKDAGFNLVAGGTDNHLLLVDLTDKDLTGQEAESTLDQVGITVNKNSIPFETKPPTITSGIRLGCPAVTTRGMKEEDMDKIVDWIKIALEKRDNQTILSEVSKKVNEFATSFPIYISHPGKIAEHSEHVLSK